MILPAARPWRPSDLEACLELFDSNVPEFFGAGERAEFQAFLADLPGPYLVVLDDGGRIVACGGWALREDGVTADLCWGMVHRRHHRQGWGRMLARARLDDIDARPGVRRVELQTSQHTVAFYERLGFAPVAVEPDGFGPGLDRVVMVRGRRGADASGSS